MSHGGYSCHKTTREREREFNMPWYLYLNGIIVYILAQKAGISGSSKNVSLKYRW